MFDFENAFSDDYFITALENFSIKPVIKGDCNIGYVSIFGRIDAYCHKAYLKKAINIPILKIDGTVFMSVTPMEVQSHIIPVILAEGRVGVGGLGLGYYVQSILEHDSVDEVVVYEMNQNVIDIYLESFGPHEKLKIVKQDVRSVKEEYFDFFYNDIYSTLLDDEVFNDKVILCQNNEIVKYHFWTQEYAMLEMINAGFELDEIFDSSLDAMIYGGFIETLVRKKSNYIDIIGIGEELFEKHCFANENIVK